MNLVSLKKKKWAVEFVNKRDIMLGRGGRIQVVNLYCTPSHMLIPKRSFLLITRVGWSEGQIV